MSTQYTTEPPVTASVRLDTTAGPIEISLFAKQTPLACRNFIQNILDGYYKDTTFHRVVQGFIIQAGDPTNTGSGGNSIYEDREFEIDPATGEKVIFGDELHSRLRFNRRGLVGMAKTVEGAGAGEYGSQFFITLADCRAQLEGQCTLFGRVEGDGIYNVVKISEGENVEGSDRPVYPFKITGGEVPELPKGESWQGMKKRERIATIPASDRTLEKNKTRKKPKKKAGKAILSFGDEEDGDAAPMLKKPKFNTALIDASQATKSPPPSHTSTQKHHVQTNGTTKKEQIPAVDSKSSAPRRKSSSASESQTLASRPRKPSLHEPNTQLPLKDPESASSRSTSTSPEREPVAKTSALNAEIASLKASMRRTTHVASEPKKPKSSLEEMIPSTSIKGRKRKRPGDAHDSAGDAAALKMLNEFKTRLESAKTESVPQSKPSGRQVTTNGSTSAPVEDDDEAYLCDLHFIANCMSCTRADEAENGDGAADDDNDTAWMNHALSFAKDRLGKDLTWKKKNEEELVVIDPREKGKEILGKDRNGRKGKA
ncbi:MAG: hypothetical protein Q9227_007647 [Pyrenula ochraceoflavens]